MIVGADVGGHHIAVAAIDEAAPGRLLPGTYIHRAVAPDADRNTLISVWAGAIDDVIATVGPEPVVGVGIAMPGPFDYRSGVAWFAGNAKFGSLHGVDIGAALSNAHHPRPLRFLNDATSFAVGCVAMSTAPAHGRVLGITLGTGLGSAFLDDGIPVVDRSDVPDHGCLWHVPFRDGIADDYVSARWLLGQARQRLGHSADGVAALAFTARAGDARATAIFADYGVSLGSVIGPWLTCFGIDTVMLGGRICGAIDLFEPALINTLGTHGPTPAVAVHQNTEDTAIVGVARTFDPSFWDVTQHRLPAR